MTVCLCLFVVFVSAINWQLVQGVTPPHDSWDRLQHPPTAGGSGCRGRLGWMGVRLRSSRLLPLTVQETQRNRKNAGCTRVKPEARGPNLARQPFPCGPSKASKVNGFLNPTPPIQTRSVCTAHCVETARHPFTPSASLSTVAQFSIRAAMA